jgi:nucleoside-diphosphate kinase
MVPTHIPRALETFAMLKPTGVRHLGDIISGINARNELVLVEMYRIDEPVREVLEEHYAEHRGKGFYEPLVDDMLKGPLIPMVWGLTKRLEDDPEADAAQIMRSSVGPTDPIDGNPAYHIRANYGIVDTDVPKDVRMRNNVIHAAANLDDAVREIGIWFPHRQSFRTPSGFYVPNR